MMQRARSGLLLLSARHTSAIYKIHRRTGDVLWRLGGQRSDFTISSRESSRRITCSYDREVKVLPGFVRVFHFTITRVRTGVGLAAPCWAFARRPTRTAGPCSV